MLERFYRSLYRIRRVEEEVARVYPSDVIKSPVHLSIGQESTAVGVCEAICEQDVLFTSYRCHAPYLAKGGDLPGMIAELYGKAAGAAGGKGGSMHLVDVAKGVMGASAVVGTPLPNAVGYALGAKIQKKDVAVACFFGDGATDEGVFHESLNFAALKRAPVLFICENNGFAIHTHQKFRQAVPDIAGHAEAHGITTRRLSDNVTEIYDAVREAREALEKNPDAGPFFFECSIYRWKEHVGPSEDYQLGYRHLEDAQPWLDNDQVRVVGEKLAVATREAIEQKVEAEIQAAFAFAASAEFPAPAELYTHVFGEQSHA